MPCELPHLPARLMAKLAAYDELLREQEK